MVRLYIVLREHILIHICFCHVYIHHMLNRTEDYSNQEYKYYSKET